MRSVGIDLEPWVRSGRLRFHASRPTAHGFETHLAQVHRIIREFRPAVAIFDPVTNLGAIGSEIQVQSMLTRLIDYLKSEGITALFTALTDSWRDAERSEVGVSSLMDTWILLRNLENDGERNRGLYVLKSRGMAHSNQIREFRLSDSGITLAPVYIGGGGVLTGTARSNQETSERAESLRRNDVRQRMQRQLERKRLTLEAQVAALRLAFDAEAEELSAELAQQDRREHTLASDTSERARLRGGNGHAMQRSRKRHERRP